MSRKMRKVMVVGSEGNMGKRYASILNSFGVEVVPCDLEVSPFDWNPETDFGIDGIVAAIPPLEYTPLNRMLTYCGYHRLPLLHEKPMFKYNGYHLKALTHPYADVFIVNNWYFALQDPGFSTRDLEIRYYAEDYGPDKMWDLIQPIFFSKKIVMDQGGGERYGENAVAVALSRSRQVIGGKLLTRGLFHQSYRDMLSAFISKKFDLLMNTYELQWAIRKTQEVIDAIGTDPGPVWEHTFKRQGPAATKGW